MDTEAKGHYHIIRDITTLIFSTYKQNYPEPVLGMVTNRQTEMRIVRQIRQRIIGVRRLVDAEGHLLNKDLWSGPTH